MTAATTATTAMSHDDAMMQRCDQNVTPATVATTAMQHGHNATPAMQRDQDATATDHNIMRYNDHDRDATHSMTIVTASTITGGTTAMTMTPHVVHNHDVTATTTAMLCDHCNVT